MRLWPSRASTPAANLSSFANAAINLPPSNLSPSNSNDGWSVSERIAAKARMRPFRLPTSRSSERKTGRRFPLCFAARVTFPSLYGFDGVSTGRPGSRRGGRMPFFRLLPWRDRQDGEVLTKYSQDDAPASRCSPHPAASAARYDTKAPPARNAIGLEVVVIDGEYR